MLPEELPVFFLKGRSAVVLFPSFDITRDFIKV
jgi:hypothetical protein